jgi:limonene-1,2-epoxide hydrolase
MGAHMQANPKTVIERLHHAMNQHDIEALLACIDPEYRSEQPAHPNRGFGGREQVETNWAAMFAGIPDFHAELITIAVEGETAWTEWHWTGTRSDGTGLDIRGVTLFGIENGRIVSGRLYMEEVEEAGEDIDAIVQRLAGHGRQGS